MGICKGCGIVVTSLYCYAHQVNVCESCIVQQHPRCVVQSYKRWLEDVDYDPNCPLCHTQLEQGEVVRLVCHDLFHLDCLKKLTQEQPVDSTLVCPLCSSPIIPPHSNVSPIAQNLRAYIPQLVSGIEMTFEPPPTEDSVFARPRGELTQQQETLTPQPRHSLSEQITIESVVQEDKTSFEELVYEDKYEKRVKQKLTFSRPRWKRTYTSFSVCRPKMLKLVCICILVIILVYIFSQFLIRTRKAVSESQIVRDELFFKVGQET